MNSDRCFGTPGGGVGRAPFVAGGVDRVKLGMQSSAALAETPWNMEESIREIPLLGLTLCLCDAMDLMSPAVVDHHKRVGYFALSIAEEEGIGGKELLDVVLAALVHDIGAFSLGFRLAALEFELDDPGNHAEVGYRLLRPFDPFRGAAPLIRYHHLSWDHGAGAEDAGEEVPRGSHILHLADRVAVLCGPDSGSVGGRRELLDRVRRRSGAKFVPGLVDVFRSLADQQSFWDEALDQSVGDIVQERTDCLFPCLNWSEVFDVAQIFCRLIDFRSSWTATHTCGVAATARALAVLLGYPEDQCMKVEIAGYLHDLGKLAVPIEILEKPGLLSSDDVEAMRPHALHTFTALSRVPEMHKIRRWAGYHHERLDGTGYPFGLTGADLSTESRLLAVADVFTALSEDRPYRLGMDRNDSLKILSRMTRDGHLAPEIVALLKENFDLVDGVRTVAQAGALEEYSILRRL
jgi:HD-GYP domain-containing protein (c-di-GMP phosphodiesterase class II)